MAALAFTGPVSPWAAVALACGAASLARLSMVLTPLVVLERADGSRTTATGVFAVRHQRGACSGGSLGGLRLALGGFPLVGLCCLGVAVIAAVVIPRTGRATAHTTPAWRRG